MVERSESKDSEAGYLLAMVALIVGGGIRFYTVYRSGFPINDGGLFFSMVAALQDHAYVLPKYVSFNGSLVPFAYPPLGFYVTALVQATLALPLIEVIRWMPAFFTSITILAVYLLATQLLETRLEAGIAAVIFALLPRSITWMIMGGGISRSPGQLFMILTVFLALRLFRTGERKYLWLAVLTSALVCLTHPEATIHTIALSVLAWSMHRNRDTALKALQIAAGTILLTAIWWLPVVLEFGLAPFASASQTGLHNPLFWLYFFAIPFSDEPHLTLVIVLAILGLAVALARKQYFLPLFYVLPFIIEPRNAANVSAIPMAMLASLALNRLVLPALLSRTNDQSNQPSTRLYSHRLGSAFSLYLFAVMLVGMLHFSVQLADKRVTDGNLEAFQWAAASTPPASRFLVLTGKTDLFGDWTVEWFPTIAQRTSLTTIQGHEWIDGNYFATRTGIYQQIQECASRSDGLECLESVPRDASLEYEYIYVAKRTTRTNPAPQGLELVHSLADSPAYELVFENRDASIFRALTKAAE